MTYFRFILPRKPLILFLLVLLCSFMSFGFEPIDDDDNDGVENSIDLCPDTPAGELVDDNGCANSQKTERSVSGTISADTTWTLENSPYLVTTSISIRGTDGGDGVTTLTIEPGVLVRFQPGCYLYVAPNSGDHGALAAIGTPGAPITFTSKQSPPWNGIYFVGYSDDTICKLDYCIIEKANQGIQVKDASPKISHSIIRNNVKYGIYCSTISSLPVISENKFTDNGTYAMYIGPNVIHYGNEITGATPQTIKIMGGTVTRDITWPDEGASYVVGSTITVQGTAGEDGISTLTIDPGVVLKFQGGFLYVGNTSGNAPGALVAVGTEESRITFTNDPDQSTRWGGIYFRDTSDDNSCVLDYCTVEKTTDHNIRVDDANPAIWNSIIRNNGTRAIYLVNSSPVITGCTISDSGIYGIHCSSLSSLPVITNNTLTNNGTIAMFIGPNVYHSGNTITAPQTINIINGTLSIDNTWTNEGAPYVVKGTVTVQSSDGNSIATLTIEPGITLKLNQGLYIGNTSGNKGALVAIGEADAPIIFTSNDADLWNGINFRNTSYDETCVLDYCVVEKASSYTIYIEDSKPSIRHTIVRKSGSFGIQIVNGSPEITGCSFNNNTSYGIHCTSASSVPLITDNMFTDNGSGAMYIGPGVYHHGNTIKSPQIINILGGVVSSDNTWTNEGVPYVVTNSITIQGADADGIATLTIEPGVVAQFNPDDTLYVGNTSGDPGALVAVGTPDAWITFTSNQTTRWRGINFRNTSHNESCVIDYCLVEKSAADALRMDDSSPTIRNSVIWNNSNCGLNLIGAGCNSSVIECNTIKGNVYGISSSSCNSMTIIYNSITSNSSYGIRNASSSLQVTAINNYWGENGPRITGSLIYGNVITSPFLTAPKLCDENLATTDTDHDGLADYWEMSYFGNLSYKSDEDTDGDGYTNRIEYLLNTDPSDSTNSPVVGQTFEYNSSGRIKTISTSGE